MGRLLASGKVPVYAATMEDGSEPAVEFLDNLPEKERGRMTRLFERLAAGHRLSNEQFKKLQGDVYEFKDHRRRMLAFSTRDGWFVTHGFEKRSNGPVRPTEIQRAATIQQSYLRAATNQRTRRK